MKQLYIPSLQPPKGYLMKRHKCGDIYLCDEDGSAPEKESIEEALGTCCLNNGVARHIAVFYNYGSPITMEEALKAKNPSLKGLDSVFEDSSYICACSEDHLIKIIRLVQQEGASSFDPDVIATGAQGIIIPEVNLRVKDETGHGFNPIFLNTKCYSGKRETPLEFWDRVKFYWF